MSTQSHPKEQQGLKELKIVLVDDSPLICGCLKEALAEVEGCNVLGIAANGLEGLTMIRALQPHLVVLDVKMPHRNGVDVLREIRKEDSRLVIVMFTAHPSPMIEEVCLKEGANNYLGKTEVHVLIDICKAQLAALNRDSQELV